MGQYCLARCRLSASSVVVCNARGRSAAAGPGTWQVRRPTADTARRDSTVTSRQGDTLFIQVHPSWTKMYPGRVAYCPVVTHVVYVPRAVLRLKRWDRQTDKWTDGRHIVTLRFPLDAASTKTLNRNLQKFK